MNEYKSMHLFVIIILISVFILYIRLHGIVPQKKVIIALIGDSTVTDSIGWGGAFADRFNDKARVLNFSVAGSSSKSWFEENRLGEVLRVQPDYVLIQFGHNDQPGKGSEKETVPDTTYSGYLRKYIAELRKLGSKPVIISPLIRRNFDSQGKVRSTLTPWAEASRVVANEEMVPFVGLHAASASFYNSIGPHLSMNHNPKIGDITHLNKEGAKAVANLVLKELLIQIPELDSIIYK